MDRPQSIFEHLSELRKRIMYSLLAIVVTISIAAIYADTMFKMIIQTATTGSVPVTLVQYSFSDAFMAEFKLAIIAGIVMAFPIVLYQLISFIMPALRPTERRILWIGLPFGTFLFLAGWGFGWFVVVPLTKQFFLSVSSSAGIQNNITPSGYIDFVLKICNPMGIAFELPLVVLILARIGLVTAGLLARIRKIAFLGILIIAAILSPPDVISLTIFFIPLYGLYEFSILLARVAGKKPKA